MELNRDGFEISIKAILSINEALSFYIFNEITLYLQNKIW